MANIRTYSNADALRIYAEALGTKADAANSGNSKMAVRAALLEIKAEATERGGECPLKRIKNGKNTGESIPPWRRIQHIAPECFTGSRSEQWLWKMMDDLGIVISGGTSRTGPLTATLAKKEVER